MENGNRKWTSLTSAKLRAVKAYNPVIVKTGKSSYDWLPAGMPMQIGEEKVMIWQGGRWKKIKQEAEV